MAPVSAAEGQWKRRALLKENGKYDDYKKKKCSLQEMQQIKSESFYHTVLLNKEQLKKH